MSAGILPDICRCVTNRLNCRKIKSKSLKDLEVLHARTSLLWNRIRHPVPTGSRGGAPRPLGPTGTSGVTRVVIAWRSWRGAYTVSPRESVQGTWRRPCLGTKRWGSGCKIVPLAKRPEIAGQPARSSVGSRQHCTDLSVQLLVRAVEIESPFIMSMSGEEGA